MKDIEFNGKILAYCIAVVFFSKLINQDLLLNGLLLMVMVCIGIPHGAIDHLLPTSYLKKNGLLKFIIKYLMIILFYGLVWMISPKFSLVVFLLLSSYHFGQVHYQNFSTIKNHILLNFSTGVYILTLILFSDFDQSAEILFPIVNIQALEGYRYSIIVFSSLLFAAALAIQNKAVWRSTLKDLIPLSLLLFFSPLLLSFILYFGFWHSLPMMIIEFKSMQETYSKVELIKFIKKLIPLTLISLIGISLILYLSAAYLEKEQMILLFFILISVISAPHIVVMDEFLKKPQLKLPS
jgi:beta-carotene 15,15'-dioxygenase